MTTAALLLSSCGHVPIKDEEFCSPIPDNLGATCDNFLTANQQILDEDQWLALQANWQKAGNATECTTSGTVGDIKAELEKLCSVAPCDYAVKAQLLRGLEKIRTLGVRLP